jgi:hypothetical protein
MHLLKTMIFRSLYSGQANANDSSQIFATDVKAWHDLVSYRKNNISEALIVMIVSVRLSLNDVRFINLPEDNDYRFLRVDLPIRPVFDFISLEPPRRFR